MSDNTNQDNTDNLKVARPTKPTPYRNAYHSMVDEPDAPQPDSLDSKDPAADTLDKPDDQLKPEENTYKKRYGDLRRWADGKIKDLQSQVTALQQNASSRGAPQLPKDEAEANAWLQQYPDVGRIVTTIANRKAQESLATVEGKNKELETRVAQLAQERALLKILGVHKDFNKLRETEDFHAWAASQPKQIQSWLYENVDDADLVIKAVNLYKLERGITETPKAEPKSKPDRKDAAVAVDVRSAPVDPSGSGKKIWRVSEIAKMTARQYEKYEAEIDLARAEGRLDINS